jgi:hypothetical protein
MLEWSADQTYKLVRMPKRSSTPKDANQLAAFIVASSTGESQEGKNPAAVALGRLGGLKGGSARAKKLSKSERTKIARVAAITRWSKRPKKAV